MKETAQSPGVRAGDTTEPLTTRERSVSPRPPRSTGRGRRTGAFVLAGSVLISGCAGLIIGNERGKGSRQPEVNGLEAQLKAVQGKNTLISNTWRQLNTAGFDHAIDIKPISEGEVKVVLSTDPKNLNDAHACKVTMDVGYTPEFSLVSYDASGEHTVASIVNKITNHTGQMALLQTVQNSRSSC